jgi:hypothetical protein
MLSECIYTWAVLGTDGSVDVDRCVETIGPGTDGVYRVGPMIEVVGPVLPDWVG